MALDKPSSGRFADAPRDKPQVDRVEHHANLERPGAQFHPRATGWQRAPKISAWTSARP